MCGFELWERIRRSSSVRCRGSILKNNQKELTSTSNESVIVANTASYSDKDGENSQVDIIPVDCTATDEGQLDCTCICCSNEMEAYQPKQRDILEQFSRKVFQVDFSIPQLEKQLSILVM
ncbi:hypothetical protein EMCRGX_G024637 [Ephydatia muelleri]